MKKILDILGIIAFVAATSGIVILIVSVLLSI